MSTVEQRLATLQALVRQGGLGPRLDEVWDRAEGLCSLAAVLVPLSEAASASWHEYLQAADVASLVQNLAESRDEDRFIWGGMARTAIALGLTAACLCDQTSDGGRSILIEPVRQGRKPGALDAFVLRLNGLEGAPANLTLIDLQAWMGALGQDGLAGSTVEISDQALAKGGALLKAMEEATGEGGLSNDALHDYNALLSQVRSA